MSLRIEVLLGLSGNFARLLGTMQLPLNDWTGNGSYGWPTAALVSRLALRATGVDRVIPLRLGRLSARVGSESHGRLGGATMCCNTGYHRRDSAVKWPFSFFIGVVADAL